MDKNKELAKNTVIITVGKICTQFMSFFLLPLYTAVLSTEEYGVVDLLITYTSLFMPVVLFQVDQALFRFLVDVRKEESGQKKIISTCMVFALIQAFAVILIFSIVQIFISNHYKWFLIMNILSCIWANMMLQTTRGLGDNITYAVGSFLSAASQIAGNIILLLIFDMGVYGMLSATILSHLITGSFVFFRKRVYRYFRIKDFRVSELKGILHYSVPLIPNALCWWALNASDRSIVLFFLGTSFNGLLSVGHKFSSVYITLYNIFNLSWTESAAVHMNDPDREEFFSGVITNMLKLFLCVGIGIIACMPFAYPLLVHGKFNDAYGLIPVFMLASMLNVVVGLYSVIYVALKKTKEIAKTSIYSGIINIVVHLALVKFVGLYAAAISSVVAFGVMAVYRYFDLKKYINIRLEKRSMTAILLLYCLTCWAYYKGSVLVQGGVLAVVAACSAVMNRKILLEAVHMVRGKIKDGKKDKKYVIWKKKVG